MKNMSLKYLAIFIHLFFSFFMLTDALNKEFSRELHPICKKPLMTGECSSLIKRYGFKNGRCVMFIYKGCRGNQNNFETKEECENTCGGKSRTETAKVIKQKRVLLRGQNSRETAEGTQRKKVLRAEFSRELNPICKKPIMTGQCGSLYKRYGFKNGRCVMFIYGGCRGTQNNFETKEECEITCYGKSSKETAKGTQIKEVFITDPPQEYEQPKIISHEITRRYNPICNLPLLGGPCRAFIRRWGYSMKLNSCVMFIWGRCLGNENNFNSKQDCEMTCLDSQPEYLKPMSISHGITGRNSPICKLPLEEGYCRASFQRWGYSTKFNSCVMFIWGGCGGNKNNFESKYDCEMVCMGIF